MSFVRGVIGASLGAAAAGIALRVRTVAKDRGVSVGEVLSDLPELLAADAGRVTDAARHAIEDGRTAADAARIQFDEQVAARARRTKVEDV